MGLGTDHDYEPPPAKWPLTPPSKADAQAELEAAILECDRLNDEIEAARQKRDAAHDEYNEASRRSEAAYNRRSRALTQLHAALTGKVVP